MVSSNGVADSDCARTGDNAVTSPRKNVITRKFTSATVLAATESTSGKGKSVPLQEPVNFLRQFRPDAFRRGDLFHRRFPQPVHGTKFSQQQIFPVLAHAGTIIENTFADPF